MLMLVLMLMLCRITAFKDRRATRQVSLWELPARMHEDYVMRATPIDMSGWFKMQKDSKICCNNCVYLQCDVIL